MRIKLHGGHGEVAIMSRQFADALPITSGARVVRFVDESDARRFLRRFLEGPGNRSALQRSLRPAGSAGVGDEDLLRGLAQRIAAGELVVVSMRAEDLARRRYRPVRPTPREEAVPPPPPPETSPPPPAPPPEETMVPNPVAQAAVLESASESGAPLCET